MRLDLSAREVFILTSFSLGMPREGVRESLHVTRNTMKTHVSGLVKKMNETSLDGAAIAVMRLALGLEVWR